MRIKDVEKLLASHARLVAALQEIRDDIHPQDAPVTMEAIDADLADARAVRAQIGRPLSEPTKEPACQS